ncbi:MAG: glycosyl hydrolase family 8 [Cypionkella sp.]
MNRRRFVASLGIAAVATALPRPGWSRQENSIAGAIAPDHPLQAAWLAWKTLCLTSEGRIVDSFQNSDSHSEGQSYGLTLAAAFDDTAAFDSIHAWTVKNLGIRPDALLAWRWKHDQTPRVPDRNNASDGDLFYAWALSAMATRHNRADFADMARAMASDLARLCIVDHPDGSGALVFLPGEKGFTTGAGYVVNPSYYFARAMHDLAVATGVAALDKVAVDGTALMASIAERQLVPDWITVGPLGWSAPPDGFSANAGYEAMRVPLFALWSGQADAASVRRYVTAVAEAGGKDAVAVFDAATGAAGERSAHPGYQAIAALAACAGSGSVGAAIPAFSTDQPYYPATLHLMALVAQAEMYPQCVPL